MADPSSADTTQLLRAWACGDSDALQQLTPRVYRELRRMAAHFLQKERPGYTLQSAELVHEVYLRLVDANQVNWQDRAHFFAVAAGLMRRILVDQARRRSAGKRGAKAQLVDLDAALDVYAVRARELIALDDALNTLAGHCQLGRAGVVLVRNGRLSWSRLRPLSLSARPRRIAIARVGDSSIAANGVLLGKDSGRHRGGRETVGLGQQI